MYSRLFAPRRLGAAVGRDPGVHPVGVGLAGRRVVVGETMVHSCSATRRQPSVRRNASVGTWLSPNSSDEPAGGHVAAEVHLPEPVLRVHVPLGPEQVGRGLRVQLRDAVLVPVDRDRRGQPGQAQLAVELGEGPPDRPDDEPGRDQGEGDEHPGGPQPDPARIRRSAHDHAAE